MTEQPKYISSYDMVYVINLDRSPERYEKVKEQLNSFGIECRRFSAIDGHQVKLKNLQTEEEFFGIDIKNKFAQIKKSVTYKVTCNPSEENPAEFNYIGSTNHLRLTLSSGELGLWCSSVMLWKDIVNNDYKNIIVFEDDIIIKVDNFKQKLNDFITHIPATYDLAYIDMHHDRGTEIFLDNNPYVSKFSDDSLGWGTWSMIYNNKAIKSLLSLEHYSYSLDGFLWSLTTGLHHNSKECEDHAGFLEVYNSRIDFLDPDISGSEIQMMGRSW